MLPCLYFCDESLYQRKLDYTKESRIYTKETLTILSYSRIMCFRIGGYPNVYSDPLPVEMETPPVEKGVTPQWKCGGGTSGNWEGRKIFLDPASGKA